MRILEIDVVKVRDGEHPAVRVGNASVVQPQHLRLQVRNVDGEVTSERRIVTKAVSNNKGRIVSDEIEPRMALPTVRERHGPVRCGRNVSAALVEHPLAFRHAERDGEKGGAAAHVLGFVTDVVD